MKDEILRLKAEGKKICQIARELNITTQSVHYNLNPAYKERHLEAQRNLRAIQKAKRVPKPKKEVEVKPKAISIKRVESKTKLQKTESRAFKTIPVDNSQKIAVKLDHKTIVYAKPGYDIDALKAKYLSR